MRDIDKWKCMSTGIFKFRNHYMSDFFQRAVNLKYPEKHNYELWCHRHCIDFIFKLIYTIKK